MLLRGMRAMAALVAVALLSGCGSNVAFSPDGKKILVSGESDALVLMNADGSNRQRLPNTKNAAFAIWSPDGRHILYTRLDWNGNAIGVCLYDLQDKASRDLPGMLSTPYTFSHDGRQVVAWDKEKACLVWLDTFSAERLLEVPCPVKPRGIRLFWLPDRYGVAFSGEEEGRGVDVYTVEAGKVYRISTTGDVVGLSMTPDGKQLLWARQPGTGVNTVVSTFVYDLDARSVQKLPLQVRVRDLITWRLPKGARIYTRAEFSPDAQWVVLVVTHFTEREPPLLYLRGVVYPLSGGQAKEVYNALSRATRAEMLVGIVWSRDSEKVAFLSLRGTQQKKREGSSLRLRVVHVAATQQRVIDL